MKTSILTLTTLVLFSVSLLTNCESSSDKVDNAKEDLDQSTKEMLKAEVKFKKEAESFKLETEKKILENDKQLANLKNHSENMRNEIQQDYDEAVEKLEKRNQFIKDQFKEFNNIGAAQWEVFSDQFNKDLDSLIQSIKDFHYKNNSN